MNSIYPNKDGLLQQYNALCHLAQVAQNCFRRKIMQTSDISQTEILWDEVERGVFLTQEPARTFCEYLSKRRENISPGDLWPLMDSIARRVAIFPLDRGDPA